MALEPEVEMLSCGRDPLTVIDTARAGRQDSHTRGCAFCQALIAADAPSAGYARTIRDQEIEVPATLLSSVMSTVWSELRPGRNIPLPSSHGSAFASEQAINSTLQNLLDLLPGFQVLTCSVDYHEVEQETLQGKRPDGLGNEHPESVDTATGGAYGAGETEGEPDAVSIPRLDVNIQASAVYSADLNALGRLVRGRVVEILETHFGLSPGSIDVAFTDIYEPVEEERLS